MGEGLDTSEEPDREEPTQQGDNSDMVEVFTVQQEEAEEEDIQAVKKVVWEDFSFTTDKEQSVSEDCDNVTVFYDEVKPEEMEDETDIVIEAFDYDPEMDDTVPIPRKLTNLAAERAEEGVGKDKFSLEKDLVVEQAEGGRLLGLTQKRNEEGQRKGGNGVEICLDKTVLEEAEGGRLLHIRKGEGPCVEQNNQEKEDMINQHNGDYSNSINLLSSVVSDKEELSNVVETLEYLCESSTSVSVSKKPTGLVSMEKENDSYIEDLVLEEAEGGVVLRHIERKNQDRETDMEDGVLKWEGARVEEFMEENMMETGLEGEDSGMVINIGKEQKQKKTEMVKADVQEYQCEEQEKDIEGKLDLMSARKTLASHIGRNDWQKVGAEQMVEEENIVLEYECQELKRKNKEERQFVKNLEEKKRG